MKRQLKTEQLITAIPQHFQQQTVDFNPHHQELKLNWNDTLLTKSKACTVTQEGMKKDYINKLPADIINA